MASWGYFILIHKVIQSFHCYSLARYCKGNLKPHLDIEKEDDEDDAMGSIMGAVYSSYRGLTWGVCVPQNCTAEDLMIHINQSTKGLLTGSFYDDNCFDGHQEIKFDTLDLVFTWIIIILSLVIIISTTKDLFKVNSQQN